MVVRENIIYTMLLPLLLTAASVSAKPLYSIPVALEGIVELQGRPLSPHPSLSILLSIEFFPAGSDFAVLSINTTTDQNGMFIINDTGLNPGNYVIRVKSDHSLGVAFAMSLNEGSNVVDFGLLPEGDANGDNAVTILDFSILSSSFALGLGDPDYDERADYNDDDLVSIADFSLLSSNFGQNGYVVTSDSYDQLLSTQGSRMVDGASVFSLYGKLVSGRPDLEADNVELELKTEVGSSHYVSAEVWIRSSGQRFDGIALQINYDASALEYLSGERTEKLPIVLQENENRGSISLASGTFTELPDSDLLYATLKFRKRNSVSGNLISVDPESIGITFAGKNILGEVSRNDVNVQCESCPSDLTLYPNPGNGIFYLYTSNPEEISLQVMNVHGILIKELTIHNSKDNKTIDLTGLPPGVYLVQARTSDSKSVHHIVKQ